MVYNSTGREQPPLISMKNTQYCSLKLLSICTEIESVINTLKQIQDRMDLKNYVKIQETIKILDEHKHYIWKIYTDIEVSE
jgi:hypothetical protein